MKKSFVFIMVLCLFLIVLSACGKTTPIGEDQQTIDGKKIIEQVDKIETAIIVPDGVYQECPEIYFAKEASGSAKDCEEYGGDRVCSYYKETKNGQEKIKNLEYLTECHACRFYGKTGVVDIGTVKMELLGLEKKECSQGMYQKK